MEVNEGNIDTNIKEIKILKTQFTRFIMSYKFALDELNTKIDILKQEFRYINSYNPIEHVSSRLKTLESIVNKVKRKKCGLNIDSIKENIQDIAGIRITCSFISDIYEVSKMLVNQNDIKVLKCKDYIKNPKPNGYKSLHLVLEIPVFMSDRVENVPVEVQIRTIAMDFWASLEHKIYYKYDAEVPQSLLLELKEAADTVSQLDKKMENIHKEIKIIKESNSEGAYENLIGNEEKVHFPYEYLKQNLNFNN